MRYCDYVLLQDGFRDKRSYEQRILRKAVAKLLEPYAEKGKRIDEMLLWWVHGDDQLKAEIAEHRKESNKRALKNLQHHLLGGFEYVKVGDRIVKRNIKDN